MRDMTIWLLLVNTLVGAIAVYYGKVRVSLAPVRIPSRVARFEQNRSR